MSLAVLKVSPLATEISTDFLENTAYKATDKFVSVQGMRSSERSKVQLQAFLTSVLDECVWSISRLKHFSPGQGKAF
jgi:hypothetical protein